jgi:UDP-glucose 4-epimerase
VFHLAANTENRPGLAGRWDDYDITVGGTVALLEALSAAPPTVTVLTSTQLVYGPSAGAADELTWHCGRRPCSRRRKLAAEAFLCAYAERTGARAVACRLANVVGPGVGRGVVADLAAQLRRDPRCLRVLGDGRQRRTFVHVDDCVSALVTAATAPDAGTALAAYNVSNRDSITLAEVARVVANCCPAGTPRIEFTGGSAWQGDATALHPDPGRLLGRGWQLTHTSREAVRSAARALFASAPGGPVGHPVEYSRRKS